MSQQGMLHDDTSGGADIETLTGNTGGAVGPDGAFNIDIVGAAPYTVSGNPGTNTLTITDDGTVATDFPVDNGGPAVPASNSLSLLGASATDFTTSSGIETHVGGTTDEIYIENRRWLSEYVVDPSATIGERGTYSTVQAAITAAVAAGGGTVYIRPGTYTENLTMGDGVRLVGVTSALSTAVSIAGTHTFNSISTGSYQNITFSAVGGGDIIVSTTGSCSPIFSNCFFIVGSNTICSTANASTSMTFYNCVAITGAPSNIFAMTAGTFAWYQGVISTLGGSPITILAAGTANYDFRYTYCTHDFETTGTATIDLEHCDITTSTTETINVNSAGSTITCVSSNITCNAASGDFAIGSGTFSYADIVLLGTAEDINAGLTETVYDWKPYATAAASEAAVTKGVAGFDSAIFTVTDGFVTTVMGLGSFPITPYVVGPIGEAGYQTIQDGLDAANAAGGGIVGVQPGTYTEDLTLYDNTQVVGFGSNGTITAGSGGIGPIIITGTHTPPTSGQFIFKNVSFTSSGSVISSAAAGTATIKVDECAVGTISGYLFDLDNWVGEISLINTINQFGGNRGINNTTGASVIVINSDLGSVGASSSNLGGSNRFYNSNLQAPIAFTDGSDSEFYNSTFVAGFTTAGSCTVRGLESLVQNSGGSAITHNSSDSLELYNSSIESGTNPSVAGTGAGSVTFGGVDFTSNNSLSGSLSVSGINSYSGTLKTDYTDHGVILGQGAATNMVATAAGTNGQVLIGATGADPAFASLTSTGSTITFTPGANTLNLETGSAVSSSFPTDSGTAIPSSGALTIVGSGGITTSGSGSTVTINGSGEQVITITSLDNGDTPYTVLTTDYYMSCDMSLGVLTIRLPNAPTTGKVFIVKDSSGDAATSNITVTTVGGAVTIDGATSRVMSIDYEALQFVFNGTSYEVF